MWALVAASLAFACVGLLYPFGRDQGNYAYPAWAWLEGQMPYRDVYVFKPPGTVWVHALAQVLFGHSMVSARLLDMGWTVATALAIAAAARRWAPASVLVGPLSGILYAFLYHNFDFWNTCQTDGWFNLPCALAILLTTRVWTGESSERILGVAGALLGLAVTLKYTAGAMALPIAGVLAASLWADRRYGRFGLRLGLGLGGLAAVLAGTGAWLWANGAIAGFLDSQAVLVPAYVEQTGKTTGVFDKLAILLDKLTSLAELRFVLAFSLAGLATLLVRRRRDASMFVAALWLVGGLASTMAQDKYFRYHFLATLPGAAILGGYALSELLGYVRARSARAGWAVAALALVALLAPSNYPDRWTVGGRVVLGQRTLRSYWERKAFKLDKKPIVDLYDCADRVRALTRAGDRVYIWGYDPLINFLAERFTVSRFLYNYPFAVSWGDAGYEAELMGALVATPPELFIVVSGDESEAVTGNPLDSRALFEAFTALSAFVAQRYTEIETVNRYTIYARNP